MSPKFYALDHSAALSCYPFGEDRIVDKVLDHVTATASKDQFKRAWSIRLRKEIDMIIDNAIESQRQKMN